MDLFGTSCVLHALLQHPCNRTNLLLTKRLVRLSRTCRSDGSAGSGRSWHGIVRSFLKVCDTLRPGSFRHDRVRRGRRRIVCRRLRRKGRHRTAGCLSESSIRCGAGKRDISSLVDVRRCLRLSITESSLVEVRNRSKVGVLQQRVDVESVRLVPTGGCFLEPELSVLILKHKVSFACERMICRSTHEISAVRAGELQDMGPSRQVRVHFLECTIAREDDEFLSSQ